MDIDELTAEYAALSLARFAEAEALQLGSLLVELAKAEDLSVVIDIRTADRTLFHAALPGAAPLNDHWARRKSNTALAFQLPSLLVGTRNRQKGHSLDRHGLAGGDFADSGGAVPIRVTGVGVLAVATVSGLTELEDHQLVVRGLKALAGHQL
jgi:uncharacterized protein (UPF0303 family)